MTAKKPDVGSITWRDLTVKDAGKVRDFYAAVVGWKVAEVDMGGYADYSMVAPNGETVAGVCHARGANTGVPPQWLMYVTVADMDESVARCEELGGKVLTPVKALGDGLFAVIQDPAGAVCALYQPVT